jgi:hypothetical protein
MKRPKQLPAVDRNTKIAAMPAGVGGVRPSFSWGDLIGPVATNGFVPTVVSAL